ncbi:MAG: signal peptidase I [Bacteroidales bacterium]
MKFLPSKGNKWFRFGIWALLYLLWVVWFGNWWFLTGLVVIFDLFITRKVKWAFWKKHYKEGEKKNVWLEWLDAIVFALVVSTFIKAFFFEAYMIPTSSMERTLMTGDYLFVSKLKYGPKVSQTPLSFPLVHNVLPITGGESYLTWIQNPYRRLAGFSSVKRDDIVVFNFPHGDTVLTQIPTEDYYTHSRIHGREQTIRMYGPIVVRPDDKKDNYVKRCVAVAGDTLQIINGKVHVNGMPQKAYPGIQNTFTVITNGTPLNVKILDQMGLNQEELYYDSSLPGYTSFPLNESEAEELAELGNIVEIRQNIDVYPPDFPDFKLMLFPFTDASSFKWTRDNFGPLWIPAKGATVALSLDNLPLYQRIIESYEGNDLYVKDGVIFINGAEAASYTFEMDYYFMLGDNRHNSLDSRYWGFVPESHVVGSPSVIWFSKNQFKAFPKSIRWKRIFKFV